MNIFKYFRRRMKCKVKINVDKGNVLILPQEKCFSKMNICIKGTGNVVDISATESYKNKISIRIYGNNNTIKIGKQGFFHASIWVGDDTTSTNDCSLIIEDGYGACGMEMFLMEDKSQIHIGKSCLISSDVLIWCTDTHCLLDEQGNLLNEGKSVIIGDHVWIGKSVYICKNSSVGDNTVIGWKSVVAGVHSETNVVLAGAPARVVKRNINWDARRPKDYLQSKINL